MNTGMNVDARDILAITRLGQKEGFVAGVIFSFGAIGLSKLVREVNKRVTITVVANKDD